MSSGYCFSRYDAIELVLDSNNGEDNNWAGKKSSGARRLEASPAGTGSNRARKLIFLFFLLLLTVQHDQPAPPLPQVRRRRLRPVLQQALRPARAVVEAAARLPHLLRRADPRQVLDFVFFFCLRHQTRP